MQNCRHRDIRTEVVVDDDGDVERTTCANKECDFILKEELIVEDPDGSQKRRRRRVRAEDQPERFQFAGEEGELEAPKERLMSVAEMTQLAVRTREETVGKHARDLSKVILAECAEVVLKGELDYLIAEDADITGEIIQASVKELKGQGYRVTRRPEPGVGTWIQVKWPTRAKAPRKKKPEVKVAEKKKRGRPRKADKTVKKQVKARLDSPD